MDSKTMGIEPGMPAQDAYVKKIRIDNAKLGVDVWIDNLRTEMPQFEPQQLIKQRQTQIDYLKAAIVELEEAKKCGQ